MSTNSEMNVQREILTLKSTGNDHQNTSPFANDIFSNINFLNPVSITQAGRYDRIEKIANPIKSWHPASKGTTERFSGCLSEIFPELKNLSDKELKGIEKKRHDL
jgi:hypothetical protein